MSEFTDIVAISQMTPGPIGINSATFVGYTAMNNAYGSLPLAVAGSLVASLAVMLPSLVLMLIISRYLMKYSKSAGVNAVFRLLRPAVVGLIASAALLLMSSENFGSPTEQLHIRIHAEYWKCGNNNCCFCGNASQGQPYTYTAAQWHFWRSFLRYNWLTVYCII